MEWRRACSRAPEPITRMRMPVILRTRSRPSFRATPMLRTLLCDARAHPDSACPPLRRGRCSARSSPRHPPRRPPAHSPRAVRAAGRAVSVPGAGPVSHRSRMPADLRLRPPARGGSSPFPTVATRGTVPAPQVLPSRRSAEHRATIVITVTIAAFSPHDRRDHRVSMTAPSSAGDRPLRPAIPAAPGPRGQYWPLRLIAACDRCGRSLRYGHLAPHLRSAFRTIGPRSARQPHSPAFPPFHNGVGRHPEVGNPFRSGTSQPIATINAVGAGPVIILQMENRRRYPCQTNTARGHPPAHSSPHRTSGLPRRPRLAAPMPFERISPTPKIPIGAKAPCTQARDTAPSVAANLHDSPIKPGASPTRYARGPNRPDSPWPHPTAHNAARPYHRREETQFPIQPPQARKTCATRGVVSPDSFNTTPRTPSQERAHGGILNQLR